MSSSLTWDSIESELRCRLFARCGQNYTTYRKLAEWLDCYRYINPDERTTTMVQVWIASPSHAYAVWKFIDNLTVLLDAHEQEMVWLLINESKTSAIPHF